MKDRKFFPALLNRLLFEGGLLSFLQSLRDQALHFGLFNLYLFFDWICWVIEGCMASLLTKPGTVLALALAPSGTYVAYSLGNEARVLSLQTLTSTTYAGHEDRINALTWSPDGLRVASASQDGTVQVWEFASGRLLFTYTRHRCPVLAVAWSPDGYQLASSGENGSLHFWLADGCGIVEGATTPSGAATSLSWTQDGTCLLSGGRDGEVYLWDPEHGTVLDHYQAHQQPISSVAWCPDVSRLLFASAGHDGFVKVWSAEERACLFVHTGHTVTKESGEPVAVAACAWSADGKRIISVDVSGTMQEWLPPLDEEQAFVVISVPVTAYLTLPTDSRVSNMTTAALRGKKGTTATQLVVAGDGWMYFGPSPAEPNAMIEDPVGGRLQPLPAWEIHSTEMSN